MRLFRAFGAAALAAALVAGAAGAGPASAAAAQPAAAAPTTGIHWAPATRASVHPGVRVAMGGVTCVAGFVLSDGTNVYLAVPGACSGSGEVPNDKCDAGQVPVGLKVDVAGARYKGTLAYSSITAMELQSDTNVNRCTNNSLSLVRLDPRDIKRTNPSIPALGGPTGVSSAHPTAPDQLMLYLASPASAQALSTTAGGWATSMMVDGAVTASDLGSVVLTSDGKALGMVTTTPESSGRVVASNLLKELRYLHRTPKFAKVHLAAGTVKFVAG